MMQKAGTNSSVAGFWMSKSPLDCKLVFQGQSYIIHITSIQSNTQER